MPFLFRCLRKIPVQRTDYQPYFHWDQLRFPKARRLTLIISTLDTYINEKEILIRSNRLIDELFTFIWNAGRAEAMKGYNDDLSMALAIGLWVRNTALRLKQEGMDLTKTMLNSTQVTQYSGIMSTGHLKQNPYEMDLGKKGTENLHWLLG